MDDDEYYYSDDDLVPIECTESIDIYKETNEKKTQNQFLQDIITKRKQEKEETIIKTQYQWDNLQQTAMQKMKKYTKYPELFFQIIESTLDQHFKKIMNIQNTQKTLKRKKKIELQERQKNFLFNCIRKQFNESPLLLQEDKKLYFNTITTIINNKGETMYFNNDNLYKCTQCNSDDVITNEQLGFQTCKQCGTEEILKGKQFVAHSELGRFSQGSKDMSKNILGFQYFIGGPIGFEYTKEHIAKMIKQYIESIETLWSNEEIERIVATFKREANNAMKKNNATTKKDLKLIAINLIIKQNPSFYNDKPLNNKQHLQDLFQSFKVDVKNTKDIHNDDEQAIIKLNSDMEKLNIYFNKIEHINTFVTIKQTLILNQRKGLSEELKVENNLLTPEQCAAIYRKITNEKQTDVATKFRVNTSDITSFIGTLENPKTPQDKLFVKQIRKNTILNNTLLQ